MNIDTVMKWVFNAILALLFFTLGYVYRDEIAKHEIREETIKRIAYAIDSGMLIADHNKILQISKNNSSNEKFKNKSEEVHPQVDTNNITTRTEKQIEEDSNILCSPTNESNVKLPEEG